MTYIIKLLTYPIIAFFAPYTFPLIQGRYLLGLALLAGTIISLLIMFKLWMGIGLILFIAIGLLGLLFSGEQSSKNNDKN